MLKWISFLSVLGLYWSSLHASRLVFEPGSDMGIILPDPPSEDEDLVAPLPVLHMKDEVKKVKRAFWDSLSQLKELGVANDLDSEVPQFSAKDFPNGLPKSMRDPKHGVRMGIPNSKCDDGKTNLKVDWDGSPVNYTCFTPKNRLPVRYDLAPTEECEPIPKGYTPKHYCMSQPIVYKTRVPSVGPHRPLWPVFGEYKFVPTQRWLHSIEHGSVVMLYHPCAEPLLVLRLKKIVKSCIYKHVITPSTLVSVEKPLVLVSWGCKLEMSYINEEEVVAFIRKRALHGPEGTYPKQGSFTVGLLEKSVPPSRSDINDSVLCPLY